MRLIALDMDGTALTSKKEMTLETVQAIKRAQERGHIVMMLSGRPPESIYSVLQKYELDCPIGASSGNMVSVSMKILELTSLTPSQNKRIIEELEKEHIPYEIYSNVGIQIPSDWKDRMDKALISGAVPAEYYDDEHFKRSLNFADPTKNTLFFVHIDTFNYLMRYTNGFVNVQIVTYAIRSK
jgi:HAD superfamily hydrolase (TIGR01484 family)